MQITSGIRSALSHPAVYTAFQTLMGARSGWRRITSNYLRVQPGETLIDIGCGPADVLDYLPEGIDYRGYDISPEYIARAKARHGDRGRFFCKEFDETDVANTPKCDVALMSGVLHHLDDDDAHHLLGLIVLALRPGGRLITIDPCWTPRQNPVARFLIERDRGRNVRDERGYRALVTEHFAEARVEVVHKSWVPYTHCYTDCRTA